MSENVKKEHKDRLFKFLFGREEHKDWTLSLYNAVNHSSYTDPDAMEFNTIQDALFLGMRNDVSFLLCEEMNLYEHQSTYNPNMPLRQLQYVANLYEKYLKQNHLNKYSSTQLELPVPRLVVFYNGTEEMEEEVILRLSDSFSHKKELADVEVTVRMININLDKNKELLESCKPLFEYAWLVEQVRIFNAKNESDPFEAAITNMPEDFQIRNWILMHKVEVKDMLLTEYDEAESHRLFRLDGYRQGKKEGHAEGKAEGLAEGEARGEAKGEALLSETLTALHQGTSEEELLQKGITPETIQRAKELIALLK